MEHAKAAAAAANGSAAGGGGGFHGYRSSTTNKPPTTPPSSGVVKLLTEINNNNNHHNHHYANNNNSNSSAVDGAAAAAEECTVREQDRFMPIANVIRIMRKILPQHAKISDDAKETIQECVSEYISFITSEANERCQREQRKTITAEDVLFAMSKLGFDDYIEPLTVYLHRYRELEGDRAGAGGSASSALGLKRSGSSNGSGGGGFMVEYLGGSSGFGTPSFHSHHHHAHSRHPNGVHNGFYGGANVASPSSSPRGNGNGSASNGERRHPIFGHPDQK